LLFNYYENLLFLGPNYHLSWANRPEDIEEEAWTSLRRLYVNIEDVPLFMGGVAERPNPGENKH